MPKDNKEAANVKEKMLKQIGKKEGIEFISDFEEAYSFDKGTGIFTIKTEDGFSGSIRYKTKIKKIIMEESIETVKNLAFKCCAALTSVVFGESVTKIGDQAFFDCTTLERVNLKNVTTIGESAFYHCKKLESVDLSNVKTIGKSAFSGCEKLKEINLSNITTIGGGTFANCEALERVNLGNNVETIRVSAFKGCKKLKEIDLSNVKTIGKWAFLNCTALESVVFRGSVDTIGEKAFSECSNLKTVTLPQNEEVAKKIKENILKQTGKNAGDGENGTIQFINDPDENAKQQK